MSKSGITFPEQKLLEKCWKIELLCKELYDYFAELYCDDMEAVQLWRKTAIEEQNHADQFTLALKLRNSLSCRVNLDPERVDTVISQMRIVLEKVRKSPPSLKDALLSSIKLEKSIDDLHLHCVVAFEDKNCKNMFKAMMASDQGHISSLQAAYDKLNGVQDWTYTK